MRDYPPIHPGDILREEYLIPMGISQYRLAKDIGVPAMRISKIAREERGVSADTALRLARYFGMSVEFWTGIQTLCEVEKAKMALAGCLDKEVMVFSPAYIVKEGSPRVLLTARVRGSRIHPELPYGRSARTTPC